VSSSSALFVHSYTITSHHIVSQPLFPPHHLSHSGPSRCPGSPCLSWRPLHHCTLCFFLSLSPFLVGFLSGAGEAVGMVLDAAAAEGANTVLCNAALHVCGKVSTSRLQSFEWFDVGTRVVCGARFYVSMLNFFVTSAIRHAVHWGPQAKSSCDSREE